MTPPESIDLQQELHDLIKQHRELTKTLNLYVPFDNHLNIVCATNYLGNTGCKNYSCTPTYKVSLDAFRYICWGCKSKGWKLKGIGKLMEVSKI